MIPGLEDTHPQVEKTLQDRKIESGYLEFRHVLVGSENRIKSNVLKVQRDSCVFFVFFLFVLFFNHIGRDRLFQCGKFFPGKIMSSLLMDIFIYWTLARIFFERVSHCSMRRNHWS